MVWNATDLMGVTIANVDTTQKFELGTKCTARNTSNGYVGEFVYMKGIGSCAAGSWALLNYDNYTISLMVDQDVGPVGVAMGATIASTYGWFQVSGKASAKLAASCADNAKLYTTATPGTADDLATGQYQITGARCAQTITSAAAAEVEINHPVVGGAAVA